VVVFRVLDPAELTFSFGEAKIFEDMESGRRIYIDPETARASYLQRFNAHAESIERICRELGVDFIPCSTDRPLELALFDILRHRLQRRQRPARRVASGKGAR
jgi:uncharacterized protein (DUF58 family)